MKFAKELEETAIPEWRANYFDYKTGKKKLRALARALRGVPQRPTHHPELPLVRDSNNVPQSTPAISIAPAANLVNERSPLRPRPQEWLDPDNGRPPKQQRMASYGSIIGSPPNSPAVHLKKNITPVPSLELPGPAARASDDIDRARSASISLPTEPTSAAHSFGPAASTQLAHTGNAYENRPPTDQPVEQDATPHHVSSRFRRLLKRAKSTPAGRALVPDKILDDRDVALETYKDADFREAEFFLFLDKELLKIEHFYKTREDEAKDRLVAIREQLHIMRECRLAEIVEYEQRHAADETESHFFDRIRPGHVGKTSRAMRNLATPNDNTWTPQPSQRDYQSKENSDVSYREAKRKMKMALAEHYRSMELLKSYAESNRKAFRKINKKYDKTVNAQPTQRYMTEHVSTSYFNTSDQVDVIMGTVEDLYARYFEKGNRKVAISKLRLKKMNDDAHTGAIIRTGALFAAGTVLSVQGVVEGTHLLYVRDATRVQQTSFLLQLYGGYFLTLFLFILFAACTAVFAAKKVNYQFIFELNRRHALSWRQMSEIPAWFLFLFGLIMYLNFNVQAGGNVMYLWWPVVLTGLTVATIFLPLRIFYPRARKWFTYSMWRLCLAGFFEVEYRDFFIGDMLMSLTYSMGGIGIFFCLYATQWKQPAQCSSSNSITLGLLTLLPAIARCNQCLRRYHTSREPFPHLANFMKYVCTLLMYMFLMLYRLRKTTEMKALFLAFAIVNTIYTSIWDVLMDWSLGDPDAKHPFLRKHLAYADHAWWYYVAMVVDPILRFNWILYIVIPLGSQHSTISSFIVAFTEVFRRGMWALFRIENEHCTNIQNEKASRDFPLPYKLHDEEENVESDSDTSEEDAVSDPTARARLNDKQKPVRNGQIPSSDISSLDLEGNKKASRHAHPVHSGRSTTEGSQLGGRTRTNTVSGSPNHDLGLERLSTDSNSSVRRRRLQHSSSSNNMAPSPIANALHRVGTTMRTAHERDFARRKPVTEGGVDSSDDDDDSDSE